MLSVRLMTISQQSQLFKTVQQLTASRHANQSDTGCYGLYPDGEPVSLICKGASDEPQLKQTLVKK